MDTARTVGLLLTAALACAAAWAIARRLDADSPTERLRAWAERRHHPVRGDGRSGPVEVVGTLGERLFTVALVPDGTGTLLVGIDCHAREAVPGPGAFTLHDGALVSRWTAPRAEDVDRLDEILVGMAELAAELESRGPVADPTE